MSAQIIHAYYAAFNAADYPGMLGLLTNDVVHDVNQGEREVGKDRFAVFLSRMNDAYREQIIDLTVLADESGTRFAAEFKVVGSYVKGEPGFPAANGQRYELPAGAFFEVRDDKIARVTTYYNLSNWLAQVGG